jgi:hypothetical protein
MRYRLMATYQGVPYEAGIGPSEGDVVLFAACPPPEELGFEPATGHWRKQLRVADVQALWESRPMGTFRGARCIILDDLGDRLHIAYLGHDAYQAEQLGYWQVDRGVFELITPRDEVLDVVEERTDYPRRPPAASAVSAPAPGTSSAHPGFGQALDARPAHGLPVPPPGPQPDAGVALPPYQDTPLPLEAAALRATSAASHRRPGPDGSAPTLPAAPAPPLPAAPAPPLPVAPALDMAPAAATAPPQPAPTQTAPPQLAPPQPALAPYLAPEAAITAPTQAALGQTAPTQTAQAPYLAPEAAVMAPAQSAPAQSAPAQSAPAQSAPAQPALGQTALGQTALGQTALAQSAPTQTGLAQTGLAQAVPSQAAPTQAGPTPYLAAAEAVPAASAAAQDGAESGPRRRRAERQRLAIQRIFSELASLAAIPAASYAVGAEVDGAMCLLPTEGGFEVFNAVGGARHEVRSFNDEESAYFYLFGVLVAEAVRTGGLVPQR